MMDFLYQELDTARAREFRAHVEGCERCGAELASFEQTRGAFRALPGEDPSPAVTARLLHEAARRAPAGERRGVVAWLADLFAPIAQHPAWAAAASLVLVGGVAGFLALEGKFDPEAERPAAAPPMVAAPSTVTTAAPGEQKPAAGDTTVPSGTTEGPAEPARAPAAGAVPEPPPADDSADEDDDDRRGRLASEQDQDKLYREAKSNDGYLAKPKAAKAPPPVEESERGRGGGGKITFEKAKEPVTEPAKPTSTTRSKAEASPRFAEPPARDEGGTVGGLLDIGGSAGEGRSAGQPPAVPQASPPPPAPRAPQANRRQDSTQRTTAGAQWAQPTGTATQQQKGAASSAGTSTPSSAQASPVVSSTYGGDDALTASEVAASDVPQAGSKKGSTGSLEVYHNAARKAAASGDCARANRLSVQIRRLSPTYYKANVASDRDLARCTKARRSAGSKAPAQAADLEEAAPAEQQTKD